MKIRPVGRLTAEGPSEIYSSRVYEFPNTFVLGNLLAYSGGTFVLADNLTSGLRAIGWTAYAAPNEIRLITGKGEIVDWPQHGLGANDTRLWLGEDGGYVTSEPTDPSVVNIQEVGRVLTEHQLWLDFPVPKDLLAAAPNDARYIVASGSADLSVEEVLGASVIMSGTLASRPAASNVAGALYYVTDSGSQRWTRAKSDGTSWEDKAPHYSQLIGTPSTFAPSAHKTSHEPGGTDAMAVDAAASVGSLRTLGTGSTQAAAGNDSRFTGAAGGDLAGNYPNPTVIDDSHGHTLATLSGVAPSGASYVTLTAELGLTAETTLTSVAPLLAGRPGGTTIPGGTASGETLTLTSTANATKGFTYLNAAQTIAVDETNLRLGIGDATPDCEVDVSKAVNSGVEIRAENESTGTTASAILSVQCTTSSARLQQAAFGSGYTAATLFGLANLTNWTASISIAGAGHVIGTIPSSPLVFGVANAEAARLDTAKDLKLQGNLSLDIAGKGIKIKEGSNARAGVSTLVAGTVTVSNTSVTANSRILLTGQNSSGTHGELTVSARTAGTSFVITSSSGTDTRLVYWEIKEPA